MTEADRGRLTEAARGEIVRLLEAIEGPLSDGHRTGGPDASFRGADGPNGHGAAPKSA
jgi:hypothetical protein